MILLSVCVSKGWFTHLTQCQHTFPLFLSAIMRVLCYMECVMSLSGVYVRALGGVVCLLVFYE